MKVKSSGIHDWLRVFAGAHPSTAGDDLDDFEHIADSKCAKRKLRRCDSLAVMFHHHASRQE